MCYEICSLKTDEKDLHEKNTSHSVYGKSAWHSKRYKKSNGKRKENEMRKLQEKTNINNKYFHSYFFCMEKCVLYSKA